MSKLQSKYNGIFETTDFIKIMFIFEHPVPCRGNPKSGKNLIQQSKIGPF